MATQISLISIETTPNPNSMKLNLSEPLGVSGTFTLENPRSGTPEFLLQLLGIPGIQSIFATADFVTLNRDPRNDWQSILAAARQILGEDKTGLGHQVAEPQGEIRILVQTFREIPIQVKVTDGAQEERVGLSQRFGTTARELQAHFGADYLKERFWADWGIRYGDLDDVANEVAEEIESLMDEATLDQKKKTLLEGSGNPIVQPVNIKDLHLQDSDWHERFRAIQHLEASEANLPHLIRALHDEQPQIRRWTAAKLAALKTSQSVEALCERLINDSNVGVRRTAGDSLSDIGDMAAQDAVCQALSDANKLVRWRAARFLAEVGTDAALPFLERSKDDPEYEVRLEIEAAIKHIREGSNIVPVWKLMSQERE